MTLMKLVGWTIRDYACPGGGSGSNSRVSEYCLFFFSLLWRVRSVCLVVRINLSTLNPSAGRNLTRVELTEGVFIVFTLGFMLEEFAASQEHGWTGERI